MLTSVSVDAISAVYTALPTGLGLVNGMVRQVQNTNKFVQLIQADSNAGASLKVGAALKLTSTNANTLTVDMTAAAGDFIFAVNDNAGVVIPKGNFFWATIKGPCKVLADDGASALTFQKGEATTGTTVNATAYQATAGQNLLLLAANASGAAALRAALLL